MRAVFSEATAAEGVSMFAKGGPQGHRIERAGSFYKKRQKPELAEDETHISSGRDHR